MADKRHRVIITGHYVDRITKGFKKTVAAMRKAFKGVFAMIRKGFKTVVQSAKWAGLAILGIGVALARLGMNAVESENLFKESFAGMADAARKWSEELSKRLGLNAFKLREQSALLFVMANSMGLNKKAAFDMAKGLTQLAVDMASFYDIPAAEAFTKLQAGISGEAEPLKRLGILVLDNVIKQTSYAKAILATGRQLTEAEKVMARYIAIMEQTSKAQGDLARTMDSPTNRLRKMKEQLIGMFTKMGMLIVTSNAFTSTLARIGNAVDKLVASGKLEQWTEKAIKGFDRFVVEVKKGWRIIQAIRNSPSFFGDVFKKAGESLWLALQAGWKAFAMLVRSSANFIFKPVFLSLREEFAHFMHNVGNAMSNIPGMKGPAQRIRGTALESLRQVAVDRRVVSAGGMSDIDAALAKARDVWKRDWDAIIEKTQKIKQNFDDLAKSAEQINKQAQRERRIPSLRNQIAGINTQITERLARLRKLEPGSMMAESVEFGIRRRLERRQRITDQINQIDASIKIDLTIENLAATPEEASKLQELIKGIVEKSMREQVVRIVNEMALREQRAGGF